MLHPSPKTWLSPLIFILAFLILALDSLTARGTADYIFYFIPVALTTLHWNERMPLYTATLCSALSLAGYYLSPLNLSYGALAALPLLNRSFTIITLWAVAFLVQTIIKTRNEVERNNWLKDSATKLAEVIRGELTTKEVAEGVLTFLASLFSGKAGTVYVKVENKKVLEFIAGHAYIPEQSKLRINYGDGLLGQAALDKKFLYINELPKNYLKLSSSLGESTTSNLIILPLIADREFVGTIELAGFKETQGLLQEFLHLISESTAIALRSAERKSKLAELLHQSQQQSEELQAQQEELRVVNEELEQQTKALKDSHMRLENQQAELEQTNQQLEEQAQILKNQKSLLDDRNSELERAQIRLEVKAKELQKSSQYKSEFLANMSHELRTPLNSTLILAKLLNENKLGNLTPEQVKYADIIYNSGNDLLNLINDILDLSKVEAGKMIMTPEIIGVKQISRSMENTFMAIAKEKNLDFIIDLDPALPGEIITDKMRIEQILKNFLSNAFKFTSKGKVTFRIFPQGKHISFSVSDTGVGIPEDQQDVIFEAFRQADGTTNRKFGGTGLGLSISKELSKMLGGTISVESVREKGSTFTLTLPQKYEEKTNLPENVEVKRFAPELPRPRPLPSEKEAPLLKFSFSDDRNDISSFTRKILVIEDDENFAKILFDLAHQNNFGVLVAPTGEEGLTLALTYAPHAILLDVRLPDHNGMVVLDQLKMNGKTRHIPVHVISSEDFTRSAMEMGAIGYMLKPVKEEQLQEAFKGLTKLMDQKMKRVLVVEDDEIQRNHIVKLISDSNVEVEATETSLDALKKLSVKTYDCMIMDLSLPDLSGFDLLSRLSKEEEYSYPPVIIYTARDITPEEEDKLRLYSGSIIIKGAKSPERLLSEVTLFLHRVETDLPPERQKMLMELRSREKTLNERKILVVDDDVRNIFALTSALENYGAEIEVARNGIEALEKLTTMHSVDLVLMDIMMPEMDGHEAMRRIRLEKKWKDLPIIALTAKAMKDDRDKCLEAGANDYLSKPLNVEKLLSLIRVWLPVKRSFSL
jgi:CheY-like chemotaxis protein/signal transduction histidine kinase